MKHADKYDISFRNKKIIGIVQKAFVLFSLTVNWLRVSLITFETKDAAHI